MATQTQVARRLSGRPANRRGSIREVSLLGISTVATLLDAGDQLVWSGSAYDVIASDGDGYVHLRPTDVSGSSSV